MSFPELERNRAAVLERIRRACEAAGRDPNGVRLVAVTKTVEPEVAGDVYRLGTRDLGENRVPEFERKVRWFQERGWSPRWHFIGHVQRNKARRVVQLADEIHSIDSLRLLDTVARVAREEQRQVQIYLQLKLTHESAKGGLSEDELPEAVRRASEERDHLGLRGLMTMAPHVEDPSKGETADLVFARLAALRGSVPADAWCADPLLSMGMSGDLELAIARGSDLVRVGSALFESKRPNGASTPPMESTP